jgi:cytochrome c2
VGAAIVMSTAACGTAANEGAPGASTSPAATTASTVAPAATSGELTPFQIEHGIGPITEAVTLPPTIDNAMAEHGEKVFEEKCAACHKMGERYVGPALGEVLTRRTPTFVMNMALNPQGMVDKHPVTKKLLAEFFTPMPNQNISPEQARQVVEYLRLQANHHGN